MSPIRYLPAAFLAELRGTWGDIAPVEAPVAPLRDASTWGRVHDGPRLRRVH